MAKILSLSKARKAKARDADAKQAEQNRILFGRTKGEKLRNKMENERLKAAIDGVKLTPVKEPENR